MENEERAHCDAHFQEELESLKISVAFLTSLLEQTLRNTSSEGPTNRPVIFNQTLTTAQPKERMSEHGQGPQHNPAFVRSVTPAPALTVMDAFANESHKAKSFDNINQDKMEALESESLVFVRCKSNQITSVSHYHLQFIYILFIHSIYNYNQKLKSTSQFVSKTLLTSFFG